MFGLPSLKQIPDIPGSMELSIHFGVQACVHIKNLFFLIPDSQLDILMKPDGERFKPQDII